jgi:hypothetical protein
MPKHRTSDRLYTSPNSPYLIAGDAAQARADYLKSIRYPTLADRFLADHYEAEAIRCWAQAERKSS